MTLPFPETFDQVKATVPVCDGYPPDTVAAQVILVPVAKDDLVHDSVVCVGAFVTVSLALRDGQLGRSGAALVVRVS